TRWVVVDVDATREAARQRALPHGPDLPSAHRRMNEVCAPGYSGRKRGEVVRSRTTVLQAHTQSWLGTFGGAGNGDYRGELLRAIEAICSPLSGLVHPPLTHPDPIGWIVWQCGSPHRSISRVVLGWWCVAKTTPSLICRLFKHVWPCPRTRGQR